MSSRVPEWPFEGSKGHTCGYQIDLSSGLALSVTMLVALVGGQGSLFEPCLTPAHLAPLHPSS